MSNRTYLRIALFLLFICTVPCIRPLYACESCEDKMLPISDAWIKLWQFDKIRVGREWMISTAKRVDAYSFTGNFIVIRQNGTIVRYEYLATRQNHSIGEPEPKKIVVITPAGTEFVFEDRSAGLTLAQAVQLWYFLGYPRSYDPKYKYWYIHNVYDWLLHDLDAALQHSVLVIHKMKDDERFAKPWDVKEPGRHSEISLATEHGDFFEFRDSLLKQEYDAFVEQEHRK